MDKIDILLVDDNDDNLGAMAGLLDRDGLKAFTARSGPQALELARQHDFALAIVDVSMPGMDGFELAEALHAAEHTKHLPLIFVTAEARATSRLNRGYQLGAIDFLFKPVDPVILQHKVGVLVGLHRQQRANVQLLESERRARLDAEQAIKVRDEVLAIVSHDLRNPLSSIMITAKLLSKVDQLDVQRHSARLLRSAQRMNHMIEDLLDLAYLEGGQLKLTRRAHDAQELMRDCVELMRPLAQQKSIEITTGGPGEAVAVDCDRERVFQVFSNLIGNAIKFTPDHGTIAVKAQSEAEQVVFSVSDSGPGIPAEAAPHVFDRFWQGHRESQGGIGLGLTIGKGIVEAHGGRIWVQTEPGKGGLFRFSLPRVTKTDQPAAPKPQRRDCTVMVVDDDADVRASVGELLTDNGYDVVSASGATEALKRLEGGAVPKLILLDLFMPEMTGDEFRTLLKNNPRFSGIATVLITGNRRFERELRRNGNEVVLTKPLEPGELLATAESFCR